MLHRPRFIALDTSHICQWIADAISARADDRQMAASFELWLEESGSIPLITLHHIEELGSHNDIALVRARLRFLAARKILAWIGDGTPDTSPGGVTSILNAEVKAAYDDPGADLLDVRQEAARHLLRVGSGEDMLGPDPDIWLALGAVFAERTASARDMVAITRTDVIDIRHMPISQLLSGRLRRGQDLRRNLDLIRGSYASDIERHGDRRIPDPHAVAAGFMQQVEDMAMEFPSSAKELVLGTLAKQGIEPEDIRPGSTIGEVLDLGLFLSHVRFAAGNMQLPWREAKRRVQIGRIPSELITDRLLRHAQKLPERKGSELNDSHLACLAAYADVTFVDKRTLETFRRARSKDAPFDAVCKRVERAGSYRDIPKILASGD